MAEQIKTNVMRLLEQANIPYTPHYYDPEQGIDGVSVAKQLGQDPDAVFKTLVTQGKSRAFFVFVILPKLLLHFFISPSLPINIFLQNPLNI